MPAAETYSALAKRYLNEPGSDTFDAFLGTFSRALISRLTVVEPRCRLPRRRRAREIDGDHERAARTAFADDVRGGYFEIEPLTDRHAIVAPDLIDQLSGHRLRTLGALHLAVAHSAGATLLATAERQNGAAKTLGIGAVRFG